jgi:CheY-like chemotaxis protein
MEISPWILLAENDPDDAFLIKRILEQTCPGFEVVNVDNGSAALECLRGRRECSQSSSTTPTVVILDHAMPGQTGLEVLRAIRQDDDLSSIPVVMCSGVMSRSQVQEAYRLGVNAYVEKPCDFDRLRRVFHQLGEFWTESNVTPSRCAI